jgi:pimeloyl-[acyl-carrier protein] synthase
MSSPVSDTTVWDPRDPAVVADPYPAYRRLRAETPIWRNEFAWVLSHHADVQEALRDSRLGTVGRDGKNPKDLTAGVPPPTGDRTRAHKGRWVLFQHAEQHFALRRLLNKGFSGSSLELLRPTIEALVDRLLDEVRAEQSFDFISRFAVPVPVTMISEMFGMPDEHRAELHGFLEPLGRTMTGVPLTADELRDIDAAVERFEAVIADLVAERRKHPGDDLLTMLITTGPDDDGALTLDEIVGNAGILLFAGHETTVGLLGNGLLALLRNPEQRGILRSRPGLVRDAVEELLRFDAPVQWVGRIAHERLEYQGEVIEPDEFVWVLIGSACRDQAVYERADELDVQRADVRALSFGRGPHLCIGAPLARLEAQIALPRILDALDGFDLATDDVPYNPSSTLRCPAELHLTR